MASTDLDQLHAVVDGRINHRRCGKTFAKCHEVAGFIELEYPLIICRIKFMRDVQHIRPMLLDVLREHELTYAVANRDTLKVEGAEVRFRLIDDLYNPVELRGLRDPVVVDMIDW